MGGILQVDTIQNNNTSNLITQTNSTTITIGTSGQTVSLASGSSSSGFGEVYNGAVNWTSTLVTSSLTVSAGVGYFVNTSTAAITLTLPSTPTFGNIVGIVDYSGYASTNNITINPNGNKIEGSTTNQLLSSNKEGVLLNYTDTTRGWIPTSGINEGTAALINTFTADLLVIAGGGGGGFYSANGAGGGGAGGYLEGTKTLEIGTTYSVTIGAGGAGISSNVTANNGVNTVAFGATANGGGGGGGAANAAAGLNGGSGGGGGANSSTAGTATQGNSGGLTGFGNNGGVPPGGGAGGGGGGAGSAGSGVTAGSGKASSITGSSVTRAVGGTGNSGGSASGGANTGTGGGGKDTSGTSGSGGSGIVIVKYPDTRTISNPGGGLTSSTSTAGGFSVTSITAGTGSILFS